MTGTPQTSLDAYDAIREQGEDVSLRLRVAAMLAEEPMTTAELDQAMPDHSANAIRPRVNELLRMGCVERTEKRTNPSGHEAYVHEITSTGLSYLNGRVSPNPDPTLSELKTRVVDVARQVARGDVDTDILELTVEQHDAAKLTMDPEWSPEDGEPLTNTR